MSKQKMQNEFQEFLNSDKEAVPSHLSENMLKSVYLELNPSNLKVFIKIAFIHFVVGAATLLFCPQFGFSLTSGMGLMHYLMKYGEHICMLGCGAFFTGTSLLVVSYALKPEEVRKLKQNGFLQLAALSTLSLGAMLCFGAEVVASLGLVWIVGGVVGGLATLELGWLSRKFMLTGRVV